MLTKQIKPVCFFLFLRFCRRRRGCSSLLIVLSCKTIIDMQATISLTNQRFDGNRHRPQYPYRGSNVYVSLCHDEALHYLRFPVLCAQGLSLHCRTLLKFMNVPTRREHKKVQESAPFASEPVLFVSGNTLKANMGYVCTSLSHPTNTVKFRK